MTTLAPGPDIECLIFDWDGTLVDTQAANYRALRSALAEQGVDLPEPWFAAHTGISSAEMVETLLAETGQRLTGDVRQVVARRDDLFRTVAHTIREHRPVADTARAFRGRGPIAVASGSSRPIIEAVMRTTALAEVFDLVVTREDVSRGKPAPDLFAVTARRLGVEPRRCLVYEDSDEGIAAAHAAGMPVVDVRPQRRSWN